jgi:hypothetical protein
MRTTLRIPTILGLFATPLMAHAVGRDTTGHFAYAQFDLRF